MNTKFAAVTALAGGLLFLASLQGTAYSASLPILNSPHNGVTLVGHGGGGGGGAEAEAEEVVAAMVVVAAVATWVAAAVRWLMLEAWVAHAQ